MRRIEARNLSSWIQTLWELSCPIAPSEGRSVFGRKLWRSLFCWQKAALTHRLAFFDVALLSINSIGGWGFNWQLCQDSFIEGQSKSPPSTDAKVHKTNIAKGTNGSEGWSFQSNFLKSYQELLHKSWSNFIFRILTKNQVQNLNQDFITVPSCLIQHFRARFYNFQLVQSFC